MKSLRIWLFVLLAVLLPLRGAVAAAMMCSPAGAAQPVSARHHEPLSSPSPGANQVQQGGAGQHGSQEEPGGHGHAVEEQAGHEHASAAHEPLLADAAPEHSADQDSTTPCSHEEHGGAQAKCNAWCDYCSVATILGEVAPMTVVRQHTSLVFPDFSAPPPNYFSGGQERPPRSS